MPRELSRKELEEKIKHLERGYERQRKELKNIYKKHDAELHREFERGCKAGYILGYFDSKKGLSINMLDIPRRVRRHRIACAPDEKSRQLIIDRYNRLGLKY